jgi:hypothetical protein
MYYLPSMRNSQFLYIANDSNLRRSEARVTASIYIWNKNKRWSAQATLRAENGGKKGDKTRARQKEIEDVRCLASANEPTPYRTLPK